MRVKIFSFYGDEYFPDSAGRYSYKGIKYTNRQFINFLKKNLIWYRDYYKDVEEC